MYKWHKYKMAIMCDKGVNSLDDDNYDEEDTEYTRLIDQIVEKKKEEERKIIADKYKNLIY